MSIERFFYVSDEELQEIDKFYDKPEKDFSTLVNSVKKWLETQPHLPQNEDDYIIEMMLKLNKFNEEKTKKKIDMFYSVRNIVPEFYLNRSPLNDDMKMFMDTLMILPLPNITSTLERIYLIRFLNTNPNNFDLISNAKYLFCLFDIRLRYDSAVGERYIFDLDGLQFGHILKVNPMIIKKIYNLLEKAYSDKIKGIHFLNMPFVGNALIKLSKLILNEKLSKRVNVHKNIESLQEIIPDRLLPADYNGLQKNSTELYESWRTTFTGCSDWLEELASKKSNEDLRIESEDNRTSIFSGILNIFST